MTREPGAGTDGQGVINVANWTALHPEDRVKVRYASGFEQAGYVDEVSDKGDVIWIRYSQLSLRKLVHKSEAVRIWCEPTKYADPRVAALHQPPDILPATRPRQ